MYEELMKTLNPKPKFNLTWYQNKDLYLIWHRIPQW